jgi:hypothetical protein
MGYLLLEPILHYETVSSMIHVRPFVFTNREFVSSVAPRLAIGIPSWRDPHKMIEAAQSWISGTIEQHGNKTMVFAAENETGERLGLAIVSHSTHFTDEG